MTTQQKGGMTMTPAQRIGAVAAIGFVIGVTPALGTPTLLMAETQGKKGQSMQEGGSTDQGAAQSGERCR